MKLIRNVKVSNCLLVALLVATSAALSGCYAIHLDESGEPWIQGHDYNRGHGHSNSNDSGGYGRS